MQRSRVLRAHTLDLDPTSWDAAWKEGLVPLDEPLSAALKALEVNPRHADVELSYRADSTIVEVFASPAPQRPALDAARLALEAAASFPINENGAALLPLHRDHATDAPQSHTLAVADTAHTLRTLSAWLTRADLTVRRITPSIAHTIAHTLELALAQPADSAPAVLLLAEHDAIVLAADPKTSSIHFVRQIPVGLEAFLAPLTRTISRGPGQPTVTLSRDQARDYLRRVGLPMHDDALDPVTSLAPRETLPLLQPPLQRLAVEIKQSLRFGLNDDTRNDAVLVVGGLAPSIPNLEGFLGKLASVTSRELPDAEQRFTDPIRRLIGAPLPYLALRTPEAGARAASKRLARALYAGSAAASLLLLADAAITDHAVTRLHQSLADAESQASSIVLPDASQEERDLAEAVALAARDIAETDAVRADWPAFLAELSRKLPPDVRVLSFSGSAEEEIVATVETTVADTAPAQSPLRDTIATLQASPLVRQIDLGPTLRDPETGLLRVSLHVALWPVPKSPLAAVGVTQ